MTLAKTDALTVLQDVRAELKDVIVERGELIDLLLTATLAKANVFIGGDPGEGKTFAINTLAQCFEARYGYHLFGADTTTDEFIGSVDVVALTKESRFTRDLSGGLCDSHFYCADEFGRGNSAALNTQLSILNERVYKNGKELIEVPLQLYAGLSNSLVEGQENAALWDRFALRYWVEPVTRRGRKTLMMREAGIVEMPKIDTRMSLAELAELQARVEMVKVSESVVDLALNLVDTIAQENSITISTRKLNQVIHLLKAFALLNGRMVVVDEDLVLLSHIFWNTPEQRHEISKKIDHHVNHFLFELAQKAGKAKDLYAEACQALNTPDGAGKAFTALQGMRQILEEIKSHEGGSESRRANVAELRGSIEKMASHLQALVKEFVDGTEL